MKAERLKETREAAESAFEERGREYPFAHDVFTCGFNEGAAWAFERLSSQAPLQVSDEMVERACQAHYEAKYPGAYWRLAITEPSENRGGHGKEWADTKRAGMRAAIEAALATLRGET